MNCLLFSVITLSPESIAIAMHCASGISGGVVDSRKAKKVKADKNGKSKKGFWVMMIRSHNECFADHQRNILVISVILFESNFSNLI